MKGLKAADPRHRPFDPEVIALNALLQVLADVSGVSGCGTEEAG
jgi:hypothetical protein